MPHPAIQNDTPFEFAPLYLMDENGGMLFVPVLKATFLMEPEKGRIHPAPEQVPINPAGEWYGDPDTSSIKYEPEFAFFKPATDVVLIGHARAPGNAVTQLRVTLQVGTLRKTVLVTGDRHWLRSLGVISMSPPRPFRRMPLRYERAFGGRDRSDPNPERQTAAPKNPVGTGFQVARGAFEDGIKLPNIEDPKNPIRSHSDQPDPAGFGFLSPHWQPRAALAGTYDDAWRASRMPLLPTDFDRRFFNGAPRDQIVPGYLKGDEPVMVQHAASIPKLAFHLPGLPPPACAIRLRDNRKIAVGMRLDTLIINTDDHHLFLVWRGHTPLQNGPHDVGVIHVQQGNGGAGTIRS